MKTIRKYFVILTTGFIACTPKPQPPVLPEVTTTGENTFGCVLDTLGIFTPKRSLYFLAYNGISYHSQSGTLSIQTHNAKDFNARVLLDLSIDSLFTTGLNPYINRNQTAISIHRFDTDVYYSFELDTTAYNWIEISKFDTITPIISGTFAFTVIDYNKQDTLHITDGRFDLSNITMH